MTLGQRPKRVVAAGVFAALAIDAPAAGQSPAALRERLQTLMQTSGLRFERPDDQSFAVTLRGVNTTAIEVRVAVFEDLAVVQSVVARNARLTPDQMTAILKLSFTADLAKVTIQGDGNVMVVHEIELRILDAPGLKRIVQSVADVTDDVVGVITTALSSTESARGPLAAAPRDTRSATLELLQSHIGIRYNPAEWKSSAGAIEQGTYQFQHTGGELYVRVVSERLQIPIESMPEVAITNARAADPKAKITRQGYRTVNGLRMLYLDFEATPSGIPIAYVGHYYSDASGTVQVIAWTGRNLLEEHRDEIERFVSGFEVRR
jgi:hypothetical protein